VEFRIREELKNRRRMVVGIAVMRCPSISCDTCAKSVFLELTLYLSMGQVWL